MSSLMCKEKGTQGETLNLPILHAKKCSAPAGRVQSKVCVPFNTLLHMKRKYVRVVVMFL